MTSQGRGPNRMLLAMLAFSLTISALWNLRTQVTLSTQASIHETAEAKTISHQRLSTQFDKLETSREVLESQLPPKMEDKETIHEQASESDSLKPEKEISTHEAIGESKTVLPPKTTSPQVLVTTGGTSETKDAVPSKSSDGKPQEPTNNVSESTRSELAKPSVNNISSTSGGVQEGENKEEPPVQIANYNQTAWNASIPSYARSWPNLTTFAFAKRKFVSGYRNQMMCFTILVVEACRRGHGQFLLDSLYHKDTYGTDLNYRWDFYWDVAHWNSFYPKLPRMVEYDPEQHSQWDPEKMKFYPEFRAENASQTKPYAFMGRTTFLMHTYIRYVNGAGMYSNHGHRHPQEVLMFQGALKPHPDLYAIVEWAKAQMGSKPYLTLHARVEPDMQKHPVCGQHKVRNLTEIMDIVTNHYPNPPPFSTVFMPINRQYLEKEGEPTPQNIKKNALAVENLQVLNRMRSEGLWNGTVKVMEFGANALKGTRYETIFSTAGAIVNYFVAVDAISFVGTEVSSYSHDILATRFFRNNQSENFYYRPDGIHDWTPPGTIDPPGFKC